MSFAASRTSSIFGILGGLRPFLRFRPSTGRFWLDVLLLLLVGALHHTVLPPLTAGLVPIDLMTPWLVTALVRESLPRAAVLTFVAAMTLETHCAAPAGTYIVAYWLIAVVLHLTRGTLSWRHAFPWVVTYIGSQVWVIGFETFILSVNAGASTPYLLDWHYLLSQLARLTLSVGIGLVLSRRYMASGAGEDVF